MFKPVKTGKITDNLYAVRSVISNFYIYDTGKNLIVFDTGISKALVRSSFKKLGLDINKVSHIFLTHSDFDHVGGLKIFKNAKVYISEKEKPLITMEKPRRVIIFNKKIHNVELLKNNEEININGTVIKIISTPGHTIGSAVYIINGDTLVTGDTISLSKNEIKSFSFIQNMNHKENIETVRKLKKEKIFDKMSLILSGHHGIRKNENNGNIDLKKT